LIKNDGPHGTVECHLARANPHWKQLATGAEALLIFSGPQAYIAPGWYPSKLRHGKVLPTWNYSVVHAYGCPEPIEQEGWLRHHVSELTAHREARETKPWTLSDAPPEFIRTMLRAIVGFRIPITRLEGKMKMSQNREQEDKAGIEQGLMDRNETDDPAVAQMVRE
jgi:transcriptional regulator